MKPTICAVVVTHNRSRLLRECLNALLSQTCAPDAILVVDNASTDDTTNLLASEFPSIQTLNLPKNFGSAGGFVAGIQWACQEKFDWIWTLDDDTICRPDTLQQLVDARERFAPEHRPNLLASKVIWKDGSLHPMNLQKPKLYDSDSQFRAAEAGTMSIRFTSFVSMFFHRSCVFRFGLPIADYFLWNDDVEYSASILRAQLGVMVPASVVTHATERKYVPAKAVGGKYYYEVRNKLWLMCRSDSFSRMEKRVMFKSLVRRTWAHLVDSGFAWASIKGVVMGIADGLIHKPRPNERVLPRTFNVSEVKPAPSAKLSIASAIVSKSKSGRRLERAKRANAA